MAKVGALYEKAALDFLIKGSTANLPAAWTLALGSAAPASASVVATWEIGTGSGYSCQTLIFPPASSPAGTATNTASLVFGPFSSAQTISGMVLKDTSATAGNIIFYGTLATPRTVGAGDTISFPIGSLTASLA
jgi:hypothetical protein